MLFAHCVDCCVLCWCVVCWPVFAVCPLVRWCALVVCLVSGGRCLAFVVCWFVMLCALFVVGCCLLLVVCWLLVCLWRFGVWCVVCCLFAVSFGLSLVDY